MKRTQRTGSALAPTLALVIALACSSPPPPGSTRHTMGSLLDTLTVLLPLSLSESRFADPTHREEIRGALHALSENSAAIEQHGRPSDAGFSFLGRSLALDSRTLETRFAAGEYAEARFLLHEITDYCVACHSRLPDAMPHPIGERLFESTEVAELPLDERAALEMATRQFEPALETLERLFRSDDFSPSDLDLMGQLDSYLELCLRVERDPQRPQAALRALAGRSDTPAALRETLEAWNLALAELAARPAPASQLVEGRDLFSRAEDRAAFADDRRALIYYIAASGVLHEFVAASEEAALAPSERAEAYFLLGSIEAHIGRAFWLSQTEHFLEAAIRTDPGGPHAEPAYRLLEEFVASGYTGSGGSHLPAEIERQLAELRALITAPVDR